MMRSDKHIVYNGFDGKMGAFATFLMATKPVSMNDPLEITGKVLWIVASAFAIAWWALKFYDRHRKNKND